MWEFDDGVNAERPGQPIDLLQMSEQSLSPFWKETGLPVLNKCYGGGLSPVAPRSDLSLHFLATGRRVWESPDGR